MVISAVVVRPDLILVLVLGVEDDVRRKSKEDVAEEIPGEAEVGPVVSILHNIKAVAVEVNLALKVHFVEGLDRNLVPARSRFALSAAFLNVT